MTSLPLPVLLYCYNLDNYQNLKHKFTVHKTDNDANSIFLLFVLESNKKRKPKYKLSSHRCKQIKLKNTQNAQKSAISHIFTIQNKRYKIKDQNRAPFSPAWQLIPAMIDSARWWIIASLFGVDICKNCSVPQRCY